MRFVIGLLVTFFLTADQQSPQTPPLPRFMTAGQPGGREVARVSSFVELQPQTAGEKERATFFKMDGGPLVKAFEGRPELRLTRFVMGYAPVPPPPWATPAAPPTDAELLAKRVCDCPLVFIGHPEKLRPYLNESGSWLVTDITVRVERAIRPERLPSTILVTRLDGEAFVNGRLIQTITRSGGDFPEIGRSYVFLARDFIGGSHSAEAQLIDVTTGQVERGNRPPIALGPYTTALVKAAGSCSRLRQ